MNSRANEPPLSSSPSWSRRLTGIVNHLRPVSQGAMQDGKFKVVICRNLGPDVMPILTSRKELEVRLSVSFEIIIQESDLSFLLASYLATPKSLRSQVALRKY